MFLRFLHKFLITFETITGFIIENFGAIPEKGQTYSFKNYTFTIEGANKKRITSIKIKVNESAK